MTYNNNNNRIYVAPLHGGFGGAGCRLKYYVSSRTLNPTHWLNHSV